MFHVEHSIDCVGNSQICHERAELCVSLVELEDMSVSYLTARNE